MFLCAPNPTLGQRPTYDGDAESKGFGSLERGTQGGGLFSMVLQPSKKEVRVYLTGKQGAQFNFEESEVTAKISGDKPVDVVLRKDNQDKPYYLLKGIQPPTNNLTIKVESPDGKSQTFKVPKVE